MVLDSTSCLEFERELLEDVQQIRADYEDLSWGYWRTMEVVGDVGPVGPCGIPRCRPSLGEPSPLGRRETAECGVMLIDILIGVSAVLSTWVPLIVVVVVPPPELPEVRR